ncbi:FAD-dependent oxidoreductase [Lentilactobacillus kosonis]|uniref:Flavodoxin reductases (Ferredoxin-NADPH reductases) family 1 n=1 Tax=Lentilactobacillus kosonis TaxID=2810561 RepID=A0A401FP77_9LACO|nr:FAD-dependent oxidoreductase [Lentilactobacillus kosonis]GAY74021.1 flavodoxin reductases (ferredoxin-NADPH reductases) family 1 [Lentilactobacillus kosonis]
MVLNALKSFFSPIPLTVKEIQHPVGDYYVIKLTFASDKKFTWRPGTAGMFTLPHQKHTGSGFRFFSIAAVPSEHTIIIGTRTGKEPSAYKSVLINLKPGDRVNLRGPIGTFGIKNPDVPAVMIASGVGITPFRAMALSLPGHATRASELIHSSHGFHLFTADFANVANQDENFSYLPVESGKEAQAKILTSIDKFGNDAYYYLSGSSKIVKANKQFLKQNGISSNRIITDIQIGY